ncbi:glycosyltransferase family 2 protein [Solwaraspora sp. WMMD791]|uniref:glycosyltransferase family 2 protein n=1 Tax=Solwaraspora sp. WMMD791 TaxID=3016086 RepID=UPI00249A6CD4|nr:glycosyltransferase family 2 protein [Solwaraspora sp. WMMD791]WFE30194.1 glycosyltransferase family 2 protein [Solwaraspora sp. WMMD791]
MNSDRSARSRRLTSKSVVMAPVPQPPAERRTVSVIIPCYNYGHFLPESVPSALSQEGVDVEVIIVDDASTDDSARVAEEFVRADPRVRLIRHRDNTGHVVAFNDGLAEASGAYIHRLDADDLLTPGALARAVALFEEFPSVGLVYGHPRHFVTSPPPPAQSTVRSWTVWSGADWIGERCRRGVNCITTPEAVVRASVVSEIGPLSLRLKFAQDMEYWLRVAAVSDVGRIDGPDQAWHRDHAASMSVTTGSGQLLDLQERRTVFDTLFDGPGGQLAQATELHRTAQRALAGEALQIASHAYDRGRTADVDVPSFVDFARETCADYQRLPQWRALQRRSRVGARLAPMLPPFAASVVWRRVQREVRYRRWVRAGV